MFNLSGSELVFILLLALVVLGPEKLPDAMRRFGKTVAELRRMGSSFQDEFRSTMDEPMRELRDTADLIRGNADFSRVTPDRTEKPKSPSAMSVDIEQDRLDGRRRGDEVGDDLDDDLDEELEDDDADDFGRLPVRQPMPTERAAPAAGVDGSADAFGAVPRFTATERPGDEQDAERSA